MKDEQRKHDHASEHGHARTDRHEHQHGRKTLFHDPQHAAEFDRRSALGGIRGDLTAKLMEMMNLEGDELVLDLATGTGRVARPVSKQLQSGRIVGLDQAKAMLDVGHSHEDPVCRYRQVTGEADSLPFRSGIFDRAFVSFSLHHFGDSAGVVREVVRVLKNGGKFVILDPVINEARDSVGIALETKINRVFRRTHGENFRFHTASSIQRLLVKAGYRIARASVVKYPFDQDGMDGIPTGRHWLEAAEELQLEAPEVAQRLREEYFVWASRGETVHVKGAFSYALICGEK